MEDLSLQSVDANIEQKPKKAYMSGLFMFLGFLREETFFISGVKFRINFFFI